MEKWIEFYVPFFRDREETSQFVKPIEDYSAENPMHPAKIMMHQTQRLVSLADDLSKIRPERDSLQLLFLIICAEHIAKLHDNFTKEGKSRAYVRRFFNVLVSQNDQNILTCGFINRRPKRMLDIEEVADVLYDIRCDVVHEGMYWRFSFRYADMSMMNMHPPVIVHIGISDLRDIVIRGCIYAIQSYKGRLNR
jgi:hypothetical protein